MEMRVFSHRDFSFVRWRFSTRRCESLCAQFGSNMRDLFIWITLFFKFCRSFNMFHFSAENTRWNKETEAESRLSSFKNYLHTIVDAPFLPLVNSSSSFGGVERTNPANKWEVWNSRQKNTSPRKRKSRGIDKEQEGGREGQKKHSQ